MGACVCVRPARPEVGDGIVPFEPPPTTPLQGSCILQQGREGKEDSEASPMLFCFTTVHTRRVEGARRGAVVRSIALCSPYGFVEQAQALADVALNRCVRMCMRMPGCVSVCLSAPVFVFV